MTTSSPDRTALRRPVADSFTAPYWEAAERGVLLVRRCATCSRFHHYPRPFCPHCWSGDVSWVEAAGTGTLYSWSVVQRNDVAPFGTLGPYIPVLVDLAEGCRMMSRLVAAAPDHLVIDQPVEVCFLGDADAAADDPMRLPFFRPRPSANHR